MERLEQYEAEGMEVGVQAAGKRVKVGETLSPPPPPPLLPHTLLAANLPDIGRQCEWVRKGGREGEENGGVE